jgi:hypothetical protein
MSIDTITFEETDTLEQKAKKCVLLFAGSSELKTQMDKLKVNYSKVERGIKVMFILRHSSFGRAVVTL